jgi:hypothetical protein
MACQGEENTDGNQAVSKESRSLPVAQAGVKTGAEFASLMSALMSDVIEGRLAPDIANATCNAGGKLLKVVEMQYKYGSQAEERKTTPFILAP